MRVIQQNPPNYQELKRSFPIDDTRFNPLFPFGEVLYNPRGVEIPEDVLFHEEIHSRQQKHFTSPEVWWSKYILDKTFRLNQEVEAYSAQLKFIKKHVSNKIAKEVLFELASNLSSDLYRLNLSYQQAESMIRSRARNTK